MTTKEIRAEWCKMKGFNYIDFDTLKEAEEYILFLESKIKALNIASVVGSFNPDKVIEVAEKLYYEINMWEKEEDDSRSD
jgi:hypothetical protein